MQIPRLSSGDSEPLLQRWSLSMHTRKMPPRHLAQVFHGHDIKITRHVAVFEEERNVFQNQPNPAHSEMLKSENPSFSEVLSSKQNSLGPL